MRKLAFILLALLSLGFTSEQDAYLFGLTKGRTFYVSDTGSDSNNGLSLSKPWLTCTKVNGYRFRKNDRVLFKGGATFSSGCGVVLTTTNSRSGYITISSYGTGQATISSGNSSECVKATNVPRVIVSNLICTGGGNLASTTDGIWIINNQSGNTKMAGPSITGTTISGYGVNGINIFGGTGRSGFNGITITGNIVHDVTGNYTGINGSAGIIVASPTSYGTGAVSPAHVNAYIARNLVYNTTGKAAASNWTGSGIIIAQTNGVLMEYNVAHDCGANSTSSGGPTNIWTADGANHIIQYNEAYNGLSGNGADGDGFALDGGVVNGVMQFNYAHDNIGSGFIFGTFVDGAQNLFSSNVTARFNISQNNNRRKGASYAEFSVYAGPGSTMTNVKIHNNTVYAGYSGAAYAQPSSGTISGNVANNIFYGVSGLNMVVVGGTPGTVNLTGNDYYAPISGAAGTLSFVWNGSTYASFAAWQTATNQEKISGGNVGLTSNPSIYVPGGGFTNGGSGYVPDNLMAYNLQSGSAMIGAGINITTQFSIDPGYKDFYGNSISAAALPVGAAVGDFGTFVATSSASSAFLARTSSFTKADNVNYDSLISGLSSDSVWSHLDFVHMLAAPNSAASLLNLKSTSYSLVSNGTVTFTARQGYVSNGTTGFLDTQYTPSTAGGNMTLASGSIGAYDLTGGIDAKSIMGATNNTTTETNIYVFTSTSPAPGFFADVNTFTGTQFGTASAKGLFAVSQFSGNINLFYNGATIKTLAIAPVALVPNRMYILADNIANVASDITTDKISMDFLGDGSVDQAVLARRVNSFMTAYSINIY